VGYITWEEYEQNLRILSDNTQAPAAGRDRGPAREGPALLQGLAVCAKCGDRMTVRYHTHGIRRVPDYVCQRDGISHAEPICQLIVGGELDVAIGKLLVQAVTPFTLEVALAVQKELESRSEDSDRLRLQAVEQARYESDLTRRRYMRCDPDNRLVADSLEAEWNLALRAQTAAQELYDKQRKADRELDDAQRASIVALATDFARLWNDPHTADRERKRMARLLIADVTLLKDTDIRAQVRFNGGATQTLHLPLPKPAWMLRQTPAAVVNEIDRLLQNHTDGEVAVILNEKNYLSGEGKPFHRLIVRKIRIAYSLDSRYARLRARGMLTKSEFAERLNVSVATVKRWRHLGLLLPHKYDDRGEHLYEQPDSDTPVKHQHQGKIPARSIHAKATLSTTTL
jgi:hypothetical protein